MMRSKKIAAAIMAAGFIALQCFSMPSVRYERFHRPVNVLKDYEEEDDDDFVETSDSVDYSGWSRDSLQNSIDSLLRGPCDSIEDNFNYLDLSDSVLQARIDSIDMVLYLLDSTAKAKAAFEEWFASLSKTEQKKWTMENVIAPAKLHRYDSVTAVKSAKQARKDSITSATPRILETPFLPDSLYYKRLLIMTRETRFGKITQHPLDTDYNYHFYDYPFMREDVNATWVGTAGSAVQPFTFTKRSEQENAIFFTPYRAWTYDASTLPMYNTKTPYTELGYAGTLFSGETKEEINLHVLTTQNVTPELNIAFNLDKYGGQGRLANEATTAYNLALSSSYLGKKYSMHCGWIHFKMDKNEGGGITDNRMIRDTSVASREIQVWLSSASNTILRNTVFINQSLRIPFGNDSLTTAYVGHTSEFTNYIKKYYDKISDRYGRTYYNNVFNLNPTNSADTMNVIDFDNRLYLRLQPWKEHSVVSKIDAGLGYRLLRYYDYVSDSTFVGTRKLYQNNVYAYAGINGMIKRYFNWDASAQMYFVGPKAGDFNVDANIQFNFFPFRRHRGSPLSIGAHFHTDLTSPDHYRERLLFNHFAWDQSLGRESVTKIGGTLDIPAWKLNLDVTYSLLGNKLYFDASGQSSQCTDAVNVITATLHKDFAFWKVIRLDNRFSIQYSSNQEVVPVPLFAMNLRWYVQFDVVKQIMQMQIGANITYNTLWYAPGYNPNTGVFFNQREEQYGNNPYIDPFINIQWKRCCIFIKCENVNEGWPLKKNKDYFTAHHYIHTQRTLKFGVSWPFYIQPKKDHAHTHDILPMEGDNDHIGQTPAGMKQSQKQ